MDRASDVLLPHLQGSPQIAETSYHQQHTMCLHCFDVCGEFHTTRAIRSWRSFVTFCRQFGSRHFQYSKQSNVAGCSKTFENQLEMQARKLSDVASMNQNLLFENVVGQFESNESSVKLENLNAHWHCDGWITYHLVIKLLLKMIKSDANDISLDSVETMMAGCLLMSKRNSCDTAFSFMWLKWKKLNQARLTSYKDE